MSHIYIGPIYFKIHDQYYLRIGLTIINYSYCVTFYLVKINCLQNIHLLLKTCES